MKIQEGRLVFDFETDDESCATQYDEWSFYQLCAKDLVLLVRGWIAWKA